MSRPDPKVLFEKLMAENALLISINPKITTVACQDGSFIVRPTADVSVTYTTPEPTTEEEK